MRPSNPFASNAPRQPAWQGEVLPPGQGQIDALHPFGALHAQAEAEATHALPDDGRERGRTSAPSPALQPIASERARSSAGPSSRSLRSAAAASGATSTPGSLPNSSLGQRAAAAASVGLPRRVSPRMHASSAARAVPCTASAATEQVAADGEAAVAEAAKRVDAGEGEAQSDDELEEAEGGDSELASGHRPTPVTSKAIAKVGAKVRTGSMVGGSGRGSSAAASKRRSGGARSGRTAGSKLAGSKRSVAAVHNGDGSGSRPAKRAATSAAVPPSIENFFSRA